MRPTATAEQLNAFHKDLFLPLVRRATFGHGLSKEDARDVVQDAFVLALCKLDARKNPRAWLMSVVDKLSINHVRKSSRRARLSARWAPVSDVPEEDDTPDLGDIS